MEVPLSHDLEARLTRLADHQGRDRGSLIVEAVERMVDYDQWFVTQVEKGLAQIESGQTLSHEDVGHRLSARLSRPRT